jgi:SAM-dependent methyltransferase
MDDGLRDRMLAYYNERASEYEEAYTRGTGTASITGPAVFTTEIAVLEDIVRGFGRGHLLDVACGTGYWLPNYIGNCSRVTLFDQSERMLAECESKVARLILESAWTDLRAKFNEKVGRQLRRLNDGTEFHIYKRCISREDIAAWDRKYGLTSNIEHFGDALCAVSVSFAKVA